MRNINIYTGFIVQETWVLWKPHLWRRICTLVPLFLSKQLAVSSSVNVGKFCPTRVWGACSMWISIFSDAVPLCVCVWGWHTWHGCGHICLIAEATHTSCDRILTTKISTLNLQSWNFTIPLDHTHYSGVPHFDGLFLWWEQQCGEVI